MCQTVVAGEPPEMCPACNEENKKDSWDWDHKLPPYNNWKRVDVSRH